MTTTLQNSSSQDRVPTFNQFYLWRIALIAAMGGLLFGYDWVVIGGAKPFYEKYFHLTGSFEIGWAMSSALVGCIIGVVFCGMSTDAWGRKRLLILSAFLFTASAIGTGLAESFSGFVLYRMLGGVGLGLASNLSPMYIAEVSPAKVRGRFVSINQLTIVIGVLAAQVVNWLIAQPVAENSTALEILQSWNGQMGWRWMFAAEIVPAVLFFGLMFFVPESPRWLVKNAKDGIARKILANIGGSDYAEFEIQDIKKTVIHEIEKVRFKDLLESRILKILGIGVFLAVYQQWCGINTLFNYAEEIFSAAGYGVSDILFNIVITGAVNLIFTLLAMHVVDRWGRKGLMLAGSLGLILCHFAIGLCFHLETSGLHVMILIVAAIGCYAFSLAPITWVLLSELFPNRIRGAAMAVAVLMLWVGCLTLTFSFPSLNASLGASKIFWLYSAVCGVGFFFILFLVPETKGKSLEQIERELVD